MASPQQVQFITQRAQALGLDPNAVLAIAGHEGIGGGIGDGGHAFGPFQLNNAGGVLTGKFAGETPQQINEWAWSPAGVNYALGGIAKVAGGLKGNAAIQAITTKFERPANPGAEIADAEAHYGTGGGSAPVSLSQPPGAPASVNAGGSATRQQLAQLVFGGGNGVNFNSNQIQTPNLVALAQLRQQSATGSGTVPGVAAPLAAASVSATGSAVGQSIAKTALTQLGQPYQFGGKAKLGSPTDCSGLLQEAAAAHGVTIPRTTYAQWQTGTPVKTSQLEPGDAVFFTGSDPQGGLPGHVGIYIGGGRYVQDPHTGGTVTISTLADAKDYVGARRFA